MTRSRTLGCSARTRRTPARCAHARASWRHALLHRHRESRAGGAGAAAVRRASIRFGRTLLVTDREVNEPGIEVGHHSAAEFTRRLFAVRAEVACSRIDTSHVLAGAVGRLRAQSRRVARGVLRLRTTSARNGSGTTTACASATAASRCGRASCCDALQDPRIVLTDAEDITICRAFRPLLEREHGIRFASEATADAFAYEAAYPVGMPFGFHGLFNFCRVVPPDELTALIATFSPAIARSQQLLQLGRNCIAIGLWRPASAIFRRILDELPGQAEAAAGLATATANASLAPTAGRNDPCPCGSGKRFKNCHGAIAPDARASVATRIPAPRSRSSGSRRRLRCTRRATAPARRRSIAKCLPPSPTTRWRSISWASSTINAASSRRRCRCSSVRSRRRPTSRSSTTISGSRSPQRIANPTRSPPIARRSRSRPITRWPGTISGSRLQSVNDVHGALDAFRRAIAAEARLRPRALEPRAGAPARRTVRRRLARVRLATGSVRARPRTARVSGLAWDGRAPAGKTLLLYAEQGLGDAIQFARYATLLADAGASTIIHCVDPLAPLLASVPGVGAVAGNDAPLPPYDAHFPLLSLPRIFETTVETIPAAPSYMSVLARPPRSRAGAHRSAAREAECGTGVGRQSGSTATTATGPVP